MIRKTPMGWHYCRRNISCFEKPRWGDMIIEGTFYDSKNPEGVTLWICCWWPKSLPGAVILRVTWAKCKLLGTPNNGKKNDHRKTTAKYKHVLLYHLHLLWVDLIFWNHRSIQLYLRMLWSPWAPENIHLRLCYNAKSSAYAGIHGKYWKNHK